MKVIHRHLYYAMLFVNTAVTKPTLICDTNDYVKNKIANMSVY